MLAYLVANFSRFTSSQSNVVRSKIMSVWYRLVLGTLVTWRVTHLLNAEDGPWAMFVRLRRAAGEGFFGELLDCFYCLSVWVAAPLAWYFGETWMERLLLVPALSGSAILVERLTAEPPMPNYIEDGEVTDGMLRKQADTGGDDDGKDEPRFPGG